MKKLIGQLLDFGDDPSIAGEQAVRYVEDGCLVVDDGKIVWRGPITDLPAQYAEAETIDHSHCLIVPGFIDAHLHFPQYRMLAAYAKDLLEWLNRYTFIEEQRYGDADIADAAAEFFLNQLTMNGTTSCVAFSTIHKQALESLFQAAQDRKMMVISGVTMMDRNAPQGLRKDAQTSYDHSREMIDRWAGEGRLGYAISPRFAVTSSQEQLEAAGTLLKENPDLWVQTHLSENHGEIELVAKDFPAAKDYTDVYDNAGLLGPRSLFAHGIHLSDREVSRLSEAGSSVVHCPTSNNFLGSGLFGYANNKEKKLSVAMGSDIGGGTSYGMLQTMRDAYIVSQLIGRRISAFDAFYTSTAGNAELLGLADQIGRLNVGTFADLAVLDPQATELMAERHKLSETIHDVLFALMMMGDDRCVKQTYTCGIAQKT